MVTAQFVVPRCHSLGATVESLWGHQMSDHEEFRLKIEWNLMVREGLKCDISNMFRSEITFKNINGISMGKIIGHLELHSSEQRERISFAAA